VLFTRSNNVLTGCDVWEVSQINLDVLLNAQDSQLGGKNPCSGLTCGLSHTVYWVVKIEGEGTEKYLNGDFVYHCPVLGGDPRDYSSQTVYLKPGTYDLTVEFKEYAPFTFGDGTQALQESFQVND
jgi:hypothetical protein